MQMCFLLYFLFITAKIWGKRGRVRICEATDGGGGVLFLKRVEFSLYFKFIFCGQTKQTLIVEACQLRFLLKYLKVLEHKRKGRSSRVLLCKLFFFLISGTHSSKILLANSLSECYRSEVFICIFNQDGNYLGIKTLIKT